MAPNPTSSPATAPAPAAPVHDYSAPLRFWHWSNWLLISGQLITILFVKVIVNAKSAAPEFQQTLGRQGIELSQQQARSLTHIISERIWDWHIYIGLTLAAFWVLRVLLEVRGPARQRFSARFMEQMRRFRLAPPAERGEAGQALFAKYTYLAFYLMLTVMVITGVSLVLAEDYAWLHDIEHPIKEVHEVTMYLILAFFAVHLVGVLWAELTKEHGLISRMIGGK